MEDSLYLTLVIALVAIFLVINIVRMVRSRMRNNKRVRDGVHSEAEVVGIGELAPPDRTEVPFTLRYHSPDGREHHREFTRGFDGIVPVPGWRVRVLFDPEDHENVEITDNSYLHPIPGAPEPEKPSPVLRYLVPALFAVAIALFAFLFSSAYSSGTTMVPVLVGGVFTLVGLVFLPVGIGIWRSQKRLRNEPAHAEGSVTHSWTETRRNRDSDGTTTTRTYYPYTVHYVLPDGRHVHKRSPYASGNRVRTVGEWTQVLYDPSEPTSFNTEGAATATIFPMVFIGFGVVFPLLGTAIAGISQLAL